jgi:hypothetical protein
VSLSIAEAEKLAGRRLDRRRKYYLVDETVIVSAASYTTTCSGCFEGGDYMGNAHNYTWDSKSQCHIGAGCDECGYTGKRVETVLVPIDHLTHLQRSQKNEITTN